MDKNILAIIFLFGLIPLLVFSYLVLIFLQKNKERMALIEKGMMPIQEPKEERPVNRIKQAFLSAGVGLGVLVGHFVQIYFGMEDPFGYLSMAFLFGGIGLITYYALVSKGKFQNK